MPYVPDTRKYWVIYDCPEGRFHNAFSLHERTELEKKKGVIILEEWELDSLPEGREVFRPLKTIEAKSEQT